MAVDRILAGMAFVLFVIFLGIVALSVKRPDLFVACAIGLGLAGYDLWRQLFTGGR